MKVMFTYFRANSKKFILGFYALMVSVLSFGQTQDLFSTPGIHTWVVPQGVTAIGIDVWGAGGGGGGTYSHVINYSSPRAGGGGGGAYSYVQLPVTPGEILTIEVGAGGAGGLGSNDGAAGGASSVSIASTVVVSADGGQGGSFRTSDDLVGTATGAGGAGGIGFLHAGGNGGPAGTSDNGAGGGGAGGTDAPGTDGTALLNGIGGANGGGNGGAATSGTDADGNDGEAPGGGGSGARTTADAGTNKGGNGGDGAVRISYCATLAQPVILTSTSTGCEGEVLHFEVEADANATQYVWNFPADWLGTSTTNSIELVAGATSGDVTVKAENACGLSDELVINVSITALPAQPSMITGTTEMCEGAVNVYAVDADANVDTYTWTFPQDWVGTSDSNSISLEASSTSGFITVVAENACGTSPERVLAVTVNAAPDALSPITGSATVCDGEENVVFSVTANPTVTTYTWSYPTGWTGTSTTNSITLTAGSTSGNITVYGENGCGTTATETFAVTVNTVNNQVTHSFDSLYASQAGATYVWLDCATGNPIPGATGRTFRPTQNGLYSVLIFTTDGCNAESDCITVSNVGVSTTVFDALTVAPNPASSVVTIANIPTGSEVKMFDLTGKVVYRANGKTTLAVNVSEFNDGVYMIQISNSNGITTKKVVVKK